MDTAKQLSADAAFWFPGRWVGGTALIVGPITLFAGVLLRLEFDFFFPEQLAAYAAHPDRIFWSYSLFLAGNIILWPAILTVSRLIGLTKPAWASFSRFAFSSDRQVGGKARERKVPGHYQVSPCSLAN